MKFYLSSMQSLAKPMLVSVLFVLFVGSYALLNYTDLPFSIPALQEVSNGKTILNVLPYYDAGLAYEYISSYGQGGVDIYYRILVIDLLVLIPIYLVFMTTAMLHSGSIVFRGGGKLLLHTLAMMPLMAAALNLIEDGTIVFLIDSYPHQYNEVATLLGFITSAKSILITVSLLAVALFYLVIGYSRITFNFGVRKCHI